MSGLCLTIRLKRVGVTRAGPRGRMPEDPWPLIGHLAPALASDWLLRPHCSMAGQVGVKGGAQLWSDNSAINIRREALLCRWHQIYRGLLLRYPELEETRVKKRRMDQGG